MIFLYMYYYTEMCSKDQYSLKNLMVIQPFNLDRSLKFKLGSNRFTWLTDSSCVQEPYNNFVICNFHILYYYIDTEAY